MGLIRGRVSIVIPARNERYLQLTVQGLLQNARGDIEIIPVCDGAWPDPPLPGDPRVKPLHFGSPRGMRPGINAAAQIATGEFLMKCDAHCIFAEGFDESLKAECDADWLVVPTRHSLDGDAWERDGEAAAIRKRDFNYTILTYPYLQSMYGAGFHAVTFSGDQNREINHQREHSPIDDILSAQGSCWFQRTEYFLSFPPLDHETFGFYQEAQETMLRVLATGGRCIVNRRTFYCHMHKGKDNLGADGRQGRGYYLDVRKKRASEAAMVQICLGDWPWPKATRTFTSIIEQHWWLISQMKDLKYAWPDDWADWEKHRITFENRAPEEIPAHT